MHFGTDRRFEIDPWKIVETDFFPEKNMVSESIFSLANEYMGTRGMLEEGFTPCTSPGCYINGIYLREDFHYNWKRKGFPDKGNFIAHTTNWLSNTVTVGGETFSMDKAKYSDYIRVLDMKEGTLSRELVFTTKKKQKTLLRWERFISWDNPHTAAMRLTVKALNHSAKIRISFSLDGRVGNDIFVKHEGAGTSLRQGATEGRLALLKKIESTGQYYIHRAQVIPPNNVTVKGKSTSLVLLSSYECSFTPEKGVEYDFDKIVSVYSSRDCGYPYGLIQKDASSRNVPAKKEKEIISFMLNNSKATLNAAVKDGYNVLRDRHVSRMAESWKDSDVEIEGDDASQQGIRYCMFQLNNTFRGNDSHLNIAAKGLTGEHYQGRHFWDTETHGVPYYLFSNPTASKCFLESRYHHLDAARNIAKTFNYKGAMYPWQTIDGTEDNPSWEYSFGEIHINAIVPYAIYYYSRVTGCTDHLFSKGIDILIEQSRFWASRSDYIPYRQGYGINRVIGPDEYQQFVNNNYYTNYMAKWVLEYTMEVINEMKKEDSSALKKAYKRTSFKEKETATWKQVADKMLLPYDEKLEIFIQDDMFLSLSPIAREDLDKERDIPLESKWSIEKFMKAQLIKQPDVLLLFNLFPDRFTLSQKIDNYKFYEQRTIHGSSLSPGFHSILATEIGRYNQAYEYYLWASRLDLDDINNNTHQGLHISAMAGTWLNVVEGFGGMSILDNGLSFNPQLPDEWNSFTFKIAYRGSIVQAKVKRGSVTFQVLSGENVKAMIYGKECEISEKSKSYRMPSKITARDKPEAVIFDLDGVITDTAKFHYKAWKEIADQEEIYFDETINLRLKGVSRMESLSIIMELRNRDYSKKELAALAEQKNNSYVKLLDTVTPKDILPGIKDLLSQLKNAGVKTAICSASKNTDKIIGQLKMRKAFDEIVTGNDTTRSKPDPQGMKIAAKRLKVKPANCLVIEDAFAGIEAAKAAGMRSMGIGNKIDLYNSDYCLTDTKHLSLERLKMLF